MNKSLSSTFYLLVPCVVLGVFGVWLARRPPIPAKPVVPAYMGPFSFSVAGVEAQEVKPVNVYDGYDRHFYLLFRDQGTRPKWWGLTISGRSGVEMKGWKFWLERGGKRTPFRPSNTQIWTTGWDDKKKRYFNEFLLHGGEVPTDAALKMSGQTKLSVDNTTTFSGALPFEVTLKKAGEKWERANVSTDPGLTVKSVEISRLQNGKAVAKVTMLLAPGVEFRDDKNYSTDVLDRQWKSYPANLGGLSFSSFSSGTTSPAGSRLKTCEFQWNAADISNYSPPDLILSQRYSIMGYWPFEIAFPVKKNGQPLFGNVPVLTRPRGK